MTRARITAPVSAAFVALLAVACPQAIHGLGDLDGGVDAGDGGSPPPTSDAGPPGTDAGGKDAGLPSDSGPATDAGSSDAGDRPILWGTMAGANNRYLHDVHGSAPNNVYAVGDLGQIHRFDGAQWTVVYQDNSNLSLHGIWVAPTGEVFAAGEGMIVSCTSGCTQPSDFVRTSANATLYGVCGLSAQQVYASGVAGNPGVYGALWQRSGGTWSAVSTNNGTFYNTKCWVAPDGAVFAAAQSKAVRFKSASFVAEPVDYTGWSASDIANQFFEDVWGDGTSVFAVGSRRRIIGRNPATGNWSFVFNPNGVNTFLTVAGPGPGEAFAAGRFITGQQLALWRGTGWAFAPNARDSVEIWGMWAATRDEYFAVGGVTSSFTGVILHGTR